jgi:hypothetical protein
MKRREWELFGMNTLFLTLASVLLWATSAQAVTLPFSENYEVADKAALAGRGWYTGVNAPDKDGTQTIQVVNAPTGGPNPRTGKVLRLQYQGIHLDDLNNDKIVVSFSPAPEIYVRYYKRTDPIPPATQSSYGSGSGFGATAKQHYLKVDGTSPDGYPNGFANHWFGARRLEFAVQNPNSNDYTNMTPVNQVDGRWYCLEYHWKMNTPNVANGVLEIWVDGVQSLGYYNKNFRDAAHANAAFTNIEIYRQGSDNMYRYEDDFVLATTRVGCGVAPPSGDTTAPSTPTGLAVN